MASYYNITGSSGVDVELIPRGFNTSVKSIMITNTHATADATISLFLNDNVNNKTFHILHTVAVPADTSLLLDNQDLLRIKTNVFGLYITVGSSDTLDVLIN